MLVACRLVPIERPMGPLAHRLRPHRARSLGRASRCSTDCARTERAALSQSRQVHDQQPPSPWRQWDGERAGHLPHHERSGGSARGGLSLPGPGTGQWTECIHPHPRAPQSARPRAPGVRLLNPTLRQMWPRERPGAAMCVQGIDVQCVLQFTLVNAAGCALHRCTSRVIHRSELYFWIHDLLLGRPAVPARISL